MNRPCPNRQPRCGVHGLPNAKAPNHVIYGLDKRNLNNENTYLGVKGLPHLGEMRY